MCVCVCSDVKVLVASVLLFLKLYKEILESRAVVIICNETVL